MGAIFSAQVQRVKHSFLTHEIHPQTETLIIGTFNPSTSGDDFFYGSPKNHLWTLLPKAFDDGDLKGKSKDAKKSFIRAKGIDFIDLISEIEVDAGQGWKRDDRLITRREPKWRNVISELEKLHHSQRVCFTRKRSGLNAVPKIKKKIQEVENYCREKGLSFDCLISPARYYSTKKQYEWTAFLNGTQTQAAHTHE